LRTLTKAEDHLGLIYDITLRSTDTARSRREEIFWTLWTLVGANAGRLHNLSQQLLLLKQVDAHRSTAVAQISALILELEGIQASLGDLRDRVAEPELLRDKTPIPLSVHIDTIDRGIERLEAARNRIRAAEDDRVRDALVKGGLKDERLLEAPEKGA
jgi:CHAD domain-containing protein